jgi:hypothetical protein
MIRLIHIQYTIVTRTHISVYSISYMNDNTNTSSESKHWMIFTATHGGMKLGPLLDDLPRCKLSAYLSSHWHNQHKYRL